VMDFVCDVAVDGCSIEKPAKSSRYLAPE